MPSFPEMVLQVTCWSFNFPFTEMEMIWPLLASQWKAVWLKKSFKWLAIKNYETQIHPKTSEKNQPWINSWWLKADILQLIYYKNCDKCDSIHYNRDSQSLTSEDSQYVTYIWSPSNSEHLKQGEILLSYIRMTITYILNIYSLADIDGFNKWNEMRITFMRQLFLSNHCFLPWHHIPALAFCFSRSFSCSSWTCLPLISL